MTIFAIDYHYWKGDNLCRDYSANCWVSIAEAYDLGVHTDSVILSIKTIIFCGFYW